jgi:hypothetical protein
MNTTKMGISLSHHTKKIFFFIFQKKKIVKSRMENQEDTKMDVVESTPSEKTNSQSESTASQRKFKPPARVSRGTSKTSTTIVYFSLQSIFETFVSNPVK